LLSGLQPFESGLRRKFAEREINGERHRESDEPRVIVKMRERCRNAFCRQHFDVHKKTGQTRQRADDMDFVKDRLKIITRQVTNCVEISRRYLSFLRRQTDDAPRGESGGTCQ
jgi:hypothetical protein